jgi:hypothetical protein
VAIAILSTITRVDDVAAILIPIAHLNAVVLVDDAHRRVRSSCHQLTQPVTVSATALATSPIS